MEEKDEKNENFALDHSAAQLYNQFAGIDAKDRARETAGSALMQLLNQEEKLLDYYRLLLAEATTLFVGILANSRFAVLAKENEQKIKVLTAALKRIAKFPKFEGKIHCRLRGQQCPDGKIGSDLYDYELSMGNFLLDFQVAQIVAERDKANGTAIYNKLMEAFRALSTMQIFNFVIDLGSGSDEEYQRMEKTIHYLLRFYAGTDTDKDFLVLDEYDQPHINLTMLAATNQVKPAALQNLVNKLKPRLLQEQPDPRFNSFTTVYEAIFASPRNRELLKKLPIEINNVQWLTQGPGATKEKTAEAVQVSRFVLAKFGSNPRMAAEVIASINSDGYTDIRSEVMGKRLTRASNFLELAADNTNKETLQQEALQNIEEGMDQVPDAIYDSINIQDGKISTVSASGEKTSWSLHEKIHSLLSFFKQRSTTKKKVREISSRKVVFDSEDYAVIARNFKISEEDASRLLDLLKSCFDDLGHFRRVFFEKNIPDFVQYGNKVFEFLWHYLKELEFRNDRVAFLNALQPLAARLSQPQDALKILLGDVFGRAAAIKYSDRNGLILSTMLLRHSNRQSRSQIELTPEEILITSQGLNQAMLKEASLFIEQNQEYIIQKFRITAEVLLKSSSQADLPEGEMPPRFLLYLQREMVIFLALVGGDSAQAIIQGVVQEFGNPGSTYYQSMRNKENLRHSLQLLQVSVRCLRRFDNQQTQPLIDAIAGRVLDFIALSEDRAQHAYIKSVLERIKKSD
jgi:hypothetical protein